jgi:glycogen debranching enzyme
MLKNALHAAVLSLDGLITEDKRLGRGIYAGLPWIYQWWTRDEAISTGALVALGRFQDAKKILLRQTALIQKDGRLGNRYPHSDLGSADGIGWTASRLLELLHKRPDIFSKEEQKTIYTRLLQCKEQIERNYMRDGLIWNAPLETWMDTGDAMDQRDGACIEIQLLHQKLNDLLAYLAPNCNETYAPVNRLSYIKEKFFNGTYLRDRIDNNGRNDETIRPNIFIACYLYPQLLKIDEWRSCMDTAINHLWMAWGGLTSIDKTSPLFHFEYTGQNNYSYHRGDSWYFINLMAAICLAVIDEQRYTSYIETIKKASAREILFSGALGHHAEISSARQQESQGCLAQAWSAAMFIELLMHRS